MEYLSRICFNKLYNTQFINIPVHAQDSKKNPHIFIVFRRFPCGAWGGGMVNLYVHAK